MRTYEKTHPWLKFQLNLDELGYRAWLLLGEAVSKIDHIAGVPLDPQSARRLHAVYLAKGVLATTAIEVGRKRASREDDMCDGFRALRDRGMDLPNPDVSPPGTSVEGLAGKPVSGGGR